MRISQSKTGACLLAIFATSFGDKKGAHKSCSNNDFWHSKAKEERAFFAIFLTKTDPQNLSFQRVLWGDSEILQGSPLKPLFCSTFFLKIFFSKKFRPKFFRPEKKKLRHNFLIFLLIWIVHGLHFKWHYISAVWLGTTSPQSGSDPGILHLVTTATLKIQVLVCTWVGSQYHLEDVLPKQGGERSEPLFFTCWRSKK